MFCVILGLGLSILITFFSIVWGYSETFRNFVSDVQLKWSNSNIQMILSDYEDVVKIIIIIGGGILILAIWVLAIFSSLNR